MVTWKKFNKKFESIRLHTLHRGMRNEKIQQTWLIIKNDKNGRLNAHKFKSYSNLNCERRWSLVVGYETCAESVKGDEVKIFKNN